MYDCERCRFSARLPADHDPDRNLRCRINPPVIAPTVNPYYPSHGVWPIVEPDDVCGKFEAQDTLYP